MDIFEFAQFHEAALERNQERHNLILAILAAAKRDPESGILRWSLGGPGQCALKSPGHGLVLGDLSKSQCETFAVDTASLDYPSVLGPDKTAEQFHAHAKTLGIEFHAPISQWIYALDDVPVPPAVPGFAKQAIEDDKAVFAAFTEAFIREAVPHDPIPTAGDIDRTIAQRRHWFWIVDGTPVALAGIGRRLTRTAAVNSVYTVPEYRGRGYAGAITAFVAKQIFDEGRKTVCLYADLHNVASNRCYLKLGFKPVCESMQFLRKSPS